MKKLMMIASLAAAVALVGCSKEKAPETGATTGQHLENAANQAGHDIKDASHNAAQKLNRLQTTLRLKSMLLPIKQLLQLKMQLKKLKLQHVMRLMMPLHMSRKQRKM